MKSKKTQSLFKKKIKSGKKISKKLKNNVNPRYLFKLMILVIRLEAPYMKNYKA